MASDFVLSLHLSLNPDILKSWGGGGQEQTVFENENCFPENQANCTMARKEGMQHQRHCL